MVLRCTGRHDGAAFLEVPGLALWPLACVEHPSHGRHRAWHVRRALQGDGGPDGHVTFHDAVREARKDDFHLDTFALRALVLQNPQSVEVPALVADPDHAVTLSAQHAPP